MAKARNILLKNERCHFVFPIFLYTVRKKIIEKLISTIFFFDYSCVLRLR